MRIFVAGCARNGTTLLAELMTTFKDTYLERAERHFDYFSEIDSPERNVVLKRTRNSHQTLHALPENVGLIYSIRHPFDTLTSHHPRHPERNFYVSPKRWSAEYASLKAIQAEQPSRQIVYVRYCDLVGTPDSTQERIAEALGLEIGRTFSQSGIPISAKSVGKYRRDPAMQMYLNSLPHPFRLELKEYCGEFGYDLPEGYLTAGSAVAAEIEKIVAAFVAGHVSANDRVVEKTKKKHRP